MKIIILGAGPAGLYAGLLIKKAHPAHDITILERNAADVTYGWGVVFSDRTLASFQRADYKTYEQIASQFVIWDAIDTCYRGETIRCGGHVIASIARKRLLHILQQRCAELGVNLQFDTEINDLAALPAHDLLIAADGLNSVARKAHAASFQPSIELGKARYIWLGAEKVLDAFTFIFRENEHGLFQVHAYPFGGAASTFIVECDEATWLKAGLDQADESASLAYCERLFADDLRGARLLSNNSKWISFPTLKMQRWRHGNIVLLGDAAHTAHFSIGSGTKLAMEDAIALASALEQHRSLDTALNEYQLERKPVVETFQRAAQESQRYFETLKRYLGLDPIPFTFQLLTRSGRITYDDLRLRDPRFGDLVDRWYVAAAGQRLPSPQAVKTAPKGVPPPNPRRRVPPTPGTPDVSLAALASALANGLAARDGGATSKGPPEREGGVPEEGLGGRRPLGATVLPKGDLFASAGGGAPSGMAAPAPLVAPPPLFTPLRLRETSIPNRVALLPRSACQAEDGVPTEALLAALLGAAQSGAGLVLTPLAAVAADGRVSPGDTGIYTEAQRDAWARIVAELHRQTPAKIALQLGHAGRRGATRPRSAGLDRPLRNGGWPLLAASPLPYTPQSQPPGAMNHDDMERVRDDFARAVRMAAEAGFDLLHLHCAQGYLLASFLSPLSNQREDAYGGPLENRLRFPLEVFDAVRAAWPEDKPLSVALSVTDCARGGFEVEDAVAVAGALEAHGCDMIEALAGQTVPNAEPAYGRGFLTRLSDQVRNEAGIPTMVGGYLTTTNEVNTIVAAGRADLCMMEPYL
ncbi:MAG TPA: FAD-dependent monooxygenase [Ktedonobacterales bacterium]|nr:FAD-dependent monooxygenase [Ktedonobacterales bacterium]